MIRAVLAVALLVTLCSTAQAHLLPKQNATMNVVDNAAFFAVSVPATALTGVDDDGNGLLSPQELQRHTESIQQQFAARFHVTDAGNAGSSVLTWLVPPQTDGLPLDSDYVVILHRVNFAAPPKAMQLTTDLFGTKPGEAQMTITATRGKFAEVAILDAGAPQHTFFRGRLAITADFIRIGVQHILTGVDHLLFLLTIIIAASGWRYWLTVVTGFTIGHSITLALSALNIIQLPAGIVEPGIAASIVLMAALNLRYVASSTGPAGWLRIAVVFSCGLLHGFGFAAAIGAMAVDTASRVATLAGFNIGIEIGQFMFIGGALVLIQLFRSFGRSQLADQVPRIASLTAAALGMLLFAQRIAQH